MEPQIDDFWLKTHSGRPKNIKIDQKTVFLSGQIWNQILDEKKHKKKRIGSLRMALLDAKHPGVDGGSSISAAGQAGYGKTYVFPRKNKDRHNVGPDGREILVRSS